MPNDLPDLDRLDELLPTGPNANKWAVHKREDGTAQVYATGVGPCRVVKPVAETVDYFADFIAAVHNAYPELAKLARRTMAAEQRAAEAAGQIHKAILANRLHEGLVKTVTLAAIDAACRERDAEIERLETWHGLLSVLDKHYPADVFDGSSGDRGPEIVVLIRRIAALRGGGG